MRHGLDIIYIGKILSFKSNITICFFYGFVLLRLFFIYGSTPWSLLDLMVIGAINSIMLNLICYTQKEQRKCNTQKEQ